MSQVTMADVLETYRVVISCRENMPGLKMEDAFPRDSIKALKAEYEFLQKLDTEKRKETPQ